MVPKSANGSDGLVVLVVEDEVLVRAMIAQYLRDCDCVVLEADSAEEVAAIGRSGRAVDVLVTDINLSGPGNGWDVAEACRAAQPDMGVVYVSGNSVDRCRCVSGSLFFNKPYLTQTSCRHAKSSQRGLRPQSRVSVRDDEIDRAQTDHLSRKDALQFAYDARGRCVRLAGFTEHLAARHRLLVAWIA